MHYLLIDTSCLKSLVSPVEESKYLRLLQFWEQRGDIRLFCPRALKQEWQKHREREIDKINKEIKKDFLKYKQLGIPEQSINQVQSKLIKQVTIIDNLIDNSIYIEETLETKGKIVDYRRAKKAPFHNNVDSFNDAFIVFSTLEYCSSNNIGQIIFISNNSKEYSSPISKCDIHPDILEDYNNVQVNYFIELNDAFKFFREDLKLPELNSESFSLVEKKNTNFYDTSKPFLEELYKSLYPYFNKIKYVHPTLFLKSIPTVDKTTHDFCEGFRLHTYNHHLFDFLSNIRFESGIYILSDEKWINRVDNAQEKIRFILDVLTDNFIWHVEHSKAPQAIDLRKFVVNEKYDFSEDFDFNRLLEESDSADLSMFNKGWLLYKAGSFIRAAKCFAEAAKGAKSENNKVLACICHINLDHLSIIIKNYFLGSTKDLEFTKGEENNVVEKLLTPKAVEEVIEWIRDKKFYNQAFDDVSQSFHDIRSKYYNNINNGWSTGDYVNVLISKYALLDSFTNGNRIVFDCFREFEDLSDLFIEALIISHSLNDNSDRLEKFNGWLIYKMIMHGNGEKLISYCKRYNIRKLKLDDDLKRNFLSKNLEKLIEAHNVADTTNLFFSERYHKLFVNIIALASLTDIHNEEIKQIARQLTSLVSTSSTLFNRNIKQIIAFFKVQLNAIPSNYFKLLLFYIIQTGNLHGQNNLFNLCVILGSRKRKLQLNRLEFDSIVDYCFKQCKKCKERHAAESIIHIYTGTNNPDQKQIIKTKIHEALDQKFNKELYYSAAIHDVITTNDTMFEQFTTACVTSSRIRLFNSKNRHPHIDALINLAFKLNKPLPEQTKKDIQTLDLYYEWLLDLDAFDYEKFNVYWLTDYATKFYFDKFRKSQLIKKYLIKYLNSNRDEKIERVYFDLYKK